MTSLGDGTREVTFWGARGVDPTLGHSSWFLPGRRSVLLSSPATLTPFRPSSIMGYRRSGPTLPAGLEALSSDTWGMKILFAFDGSVVYSAAVKKSAASGSSQWAQTAWRGHLYGQAQEEEPGGGTLGSKGWPRAMEGRSR